MYFNSVEISLTFWASFLLNGNIRYIFESLLQWGYLNWFSLYFLSHCSAVSFHLITLCSYALTYGIVGSTVVSCNRLRASKRGMPVYLSLSPPPPGLSPSQTLGYSIIILRTSIHNGCRNLPQEWARKETAWLCWNMCLEQEQSFIINENFSFSDFIL